MDREALTAALDIHASMRSHDDLLQIATAARERLAQLPEKCEHEAHNGLALACHVDPPVVLKHLHNSGCYCPSCHGSGKVYPAELVERIMEVSGLSESLTVAVLDSLNETP